MVRHAARCCPLAMLECGDVPPDAQDCCAAAQGRPASGPGPSGGPTRTPGLTSAMVVPSDVQPNANGERQMRAGPALFIRLHPPWRPSPTGMKRPDRRPSRSRSQFAVPRPSARSCSARPARAPPPGAVSQPARPWQAALTAPARPLGIHAAPAPLGWAQQRPRRPAPPPPPARRRRWPTRAGPQPSSRSRSSRSHGSARGAGAAAHERGADEPV